MDGYRTAYKIVEQYKKELEIWKQKTGQNDIQPERKKSVLERLKENEKRVKERGRPKSVSNRRKFVVWDYLSCVRLLKIVLKSVWKISASAISSLIRIL